MNAVADNWIRRHRITVDEYYRMAEVGLLAEDARVELIEGEVIDMSPIGPKHADIVDRLVRILAKSLGDDVGMGVQRPIRLGKQSEPNRISWSTSRIGPIGTGIPLQRMFYC